MRVALAVFHADYAQVVLSDRASRDYPQWETGSERAVHSTDAVAVAVREDIEGDVRVEAWLDGRLAQSEAPVYQCRLTFHSGEAYIGTTEASPDKRKFFLIDPGPIDVESM